MKEHTQEIKSGNRFAFGQNWSNYLSHFDEQCLEDAVQSLQEMLGIQDLSNKTFLDIGSGSGLFSLAARKLGAKVHSLDYDPDSVKCTQMLKEKFYKDDSDWHVEEGSVLNKKYLNDLGTFDIVYSWGVLHHTGDMWTAIDNASERVKDKGLVFISIYNDQNLKSKAWKKIKKLYCSGVPGKIITTLLYFPYYFVKHFIIDVLKKRNPFKHYSKGAIKRGMLVYYDLWDWLGGYPFEVAKPEEIFHFFKKRDFTLENLTTQNGKGTNQFVFSKK